MTIVASPDGWIQTYTGGKVWPMHGEGDIKIEDIAHALSNICRFGGHCKFHYSVAQHSYYVSTIVPEHLALHGLLHDAAEAYLGDVPRPIKHGKGMEPFRKAEASMEWVIAYGFGLETTDESTRLVKEADNVVLATERRDLMVVRPEGDDWLHGAGAAEPMGRRIMQWRPEAAERNFLLRYRELIRVDGGW